jgi:CHASE3 domain sensor protein
MFDRLRISVRIATVLAIVLTLLLVVGGTGIWTANQMGASVDELRDLDKVSSVVEGARSATIAYATSAVGRARCECRRWPEVAERRSRRC